MNKLGLHIISGWSGNLGRPRVVKLVNVDVRYVAQVRGQVGPECLIIVRFEHDEPPLLPNPEQAARDWHGRRRGDMLAMAAAAGPNIAFEAGKNEVPSDLLALFVRFSLALIPLMHADGMRIVWGNCAVGNWRESAWPLAKPALAALNADDLVGLHEYWSDGEDLGNPWHVGRWRIPEIAAVLRGYKKVVTECGRDYLPDTKKGQPGWQLTCDASTFFGELCRYNDEVLVPDPDVEGATVFGAGNDRRWEKFDPSAVWPRVVAYAGAEPPAVPAPEPEPPKEEPVKPDYSGAIWKGATNYGYPRGTPGRQGYPVIAICHHVIDGYISYLDTMVNDKSKAISYTYCVGKDGRIHQYVEEVNAAWANGDVQSSKWPLLIPGVNPNLYTISIALEGFSGEPVTEAAYASLLKLDRDVIGRHAGIVVDTDHIIGHYRINSVTRSQCPGPTFPWVRLLAALAPEPAPSLAQMAVAARWNAEEAVRELEAAGVPRDLAGMCRLYGLIDLQNGLLYQVERALKSS